MTITVKNLNESKQTAYLTYAYFLGEEKRNEKTFIPTLYSYVSLTNASR